MSASPTRTRLGAVAFAVAAVLFILYPVVRPWKDESTVGLLSLGVGVVLAAVAIWRSGVLPRYSRILFALGFALFTPHFYAAPVRIGHRVLVAVGSTWVAVALWKASEVEARS